MNKQDNATQQAVYQKGIYMVTPKIVVDRIAQILTEQYPSCTLYLHNVPANIVRPSLTSILILTGLKPIA